MKGPAANGSEDRIDYLLDVAAELFLSKGFSETSVGEIAAQGKASKSTFYSRFPTKEKLFTEVFRRRADACFHELSSVLRPEGEPREVLILFAQSLVRKVLTPDSINLIRLVYMESKHIPELGQIFYELGPQKGRNQSSAYFQELVKRGFFRSDMDTNVGAEQFFDLVCGEMLRRCALSIKPAFSPEQEAYRVNIAVDMFIRAYGA